MINKHNLELIKKLNISCPECLKILNKSKELNSSYSKEHLI